MTHMKVDYLKEEVLRLSTVHVRVHFEYIQTS